MAKRAVAIVELRATSVNGQVDPLAPALFEHAENRETYNENPSG